MNEMMVVVSTVVGIVASLCTVFGFFEGRWRLKAKTDVIEGRPVSRRDRTSPKGEHFKQETPQLVEGGEPAPGNEKDRSPLTKGSRP